jgi:hypothetical protein
VNNPAYRLYNPSAAHAKKKKKALRNEGYKLQGMPKRNELKKKKKSGQKNIKISLRKE